MNAGTQIISLLEKVRKVTRSCKRSCVGCYSLEDYGRVRSHPLDIPIGKGTITCHRASNMSSVAMTVIRGSSGPVSDDGQVIEIVMDVTVRIVIINTRIYTGICDSYSLTGPVESIK